MGFLLFPNRNLPRKDAAFSFAFEMISARKLDVFTGGSEVDFSDVGWRSDGLTDVLGDGLGIGFGGGRGGRAISLGDG